MKMIDYAMYKPIEDMTPGGMCAAIGSLRFEVARLRQDNAQLQYALEQSESAHLGLTQILRHDLVHQSCPMSANLAASPRRPPP